MDDADVVVVAHYNEDLGWTSRVGRGRRVVVMSHGKPDADMYFADNVGFEARLYLEYIVAHYDDLSPYTFFVHGHCTSPHHAGEMPDLLNGTECAHPYLCINLWAAVNRDLQLNPDFQRAAPMVFGEALGLGGARPLPETHTRPCAMFYVHRDLVRRHPKAAYQRWLDGIVSREFLSRGAMGDDKGVAILFEWMWFPVLTGEFDEEAYERRLGAQAPGT